jgi:hypothetical protein
MRRYIDFYLASMRISILQQIQYRVANYFYMIGMITEPVIYLVVWSTIAEQQGGSVGGFTPGTFAAYYIVWTLVRNMNIVFTPYGWEWRIREGMLSAELMRPMHPIHWDIAYFSGWKFVVILLWLPLAAFLSWVFKPTFNVSLMEVVVFFIAIWGGVSHPHHDPYPARHDHLLDDPRQRDLRVVLWSRVDSFRSSCSPDSHAAMGAIPFELPALQVDFLFPDRDSGWVHVSSRTVAGCWHPGFMDRDRRGSPEFGLAHRYPAILGGGWLEFR